MDKKPRAPGDMGEAKPMKEPPRKPHGDKIDTNDDPTSGDMAQKQRDKMQRQKTTEGDR